MKGIKKYLPLILLICALTGCGGLDAGANLKSDVSVRTEVSGSAVKSTVDYGNEDEKQDAEFQNSIGRIDYPLIDLYFEGEKTYRLELVDYTGQNVVKEYTDQGDFFQFTKEYFSIITCPSGRGTTPPYILSIYEGETRIKDIDCVEVRPGILDDKW